MKAEAMAKGDYRSNQPRKSRPPTDNDRLRLVLAECVGELEILSAGEACDHSVGICWCSCFSAIEKAKRLLAAHDRSEKFIAELGA